MKRFLAALIVVCLTVLICATPVHAIEPEPAFDGLSGDSEFLGWPSAGLHKLYTDDMGLLDAIDAIGNSLSNLLWSMDVELSYICLRLYYKALNIDILELLGGATNNIQKGLVQSIFEPLLILGYAAIALHLIRWLLRRNVTAIFGEIARVLCVVVVSTLLVSNTQQVLSGITGFSRELGLSVVMQLNEEETSEGGDFAAETAGLLWQDLIHRPWIGLNFIGSGNPPSRAEYVGFLIPQEGYEHSNPVFEEMASQNSDLLPAARIAGFAAEYKEANPGAFDKSVGWSRLGQLLLYFVPFVAKLAVYVFCAFLMIAFQLAALFFALTGPIILILSLFDTFGGPQLVVSWGKKIIETQIGLLIIAILLGLVIKVGSAINTFMAASLGWLGAAVIQSILMVMLIMLRKQIFGLFRKVSANPAALPQAILNFNAASMAQELRQEHRYRKSWRYQRNNARYFQEAREQQQEISAHTADVRRLQAEKLQREKEWDEAHPNSNPHDKRYFHFYSPRSTPDDTEPAPTESPSKPVRRPTARRPETEPQRDTFATQGEPTQQETPTSAPAPKPRTSRRPADGRTDVPAEGAEQSTDDRQTDDHRAPRRRKSRSAKQDDAPQDGAHGPESTPPEPQPIRGHRTAAPAQPPQTPAVARPKAENPELHPARRPEDPADLSAPHTVARPRILNDRRKDPWDGQDRPEPWDGSSGESPPPRRRKRPEGP